MKFVIKTTPKTKKLLILNKIEIESTESKMKTKRTCYVFSHDVTKWKFLFLFFF